ncbi:MAG: prephenate dehydrogenase, partial [Thermosulfidibacteraceae bacterium]
MKVTIVGLGLIGASIALSLKERVDVEIVAVDLDRESLNYAKSMGWIDVPRGTPDSSVTGSEYVVLATHLDVIREVAKSVLAFLSGSELVMDVSSVKAWIVENVAPLFQGISAFVPTHPIAGTEKHGAKNAVKDLFFGARLIITPWNNSDRDIEKARYFWELLGSKVEFMDPYEHDRIFSKVSHLPHLIAYALVDMLTDGSEYAIRYAGSGFRDFTRIAASSPTMWVEIFRCNRENLLVDLEKMI